MKRVGGPVPARWDGRPFRILAFDPGGSTGWAYAAAQQLNTMEDITFDCGHLGPEEHHIELWNFLTSQVPLEGFDAPLEIVCESFEFRQQTDPHKTKSKVELISKEYIGIIKLFAARADLPLTFYTASAAKHLVPDKGPESNVRLKQLGWYRPVTHWVHAMDATRHLLRYMVIDKKIRNPITDKWLED